jgi:hypothetical protein
MGGQFCTLIDRIAAPATELQAVHQFGFFVWQMGLKELNGQGHLHFPLLTAGGILIEKHSHSESMPSGSSREPNKTCSSFALGFKRLKFFWQFFFLSRRHFIESVVRTFNSAYMQSGYLSGPLKTFSFTVAYYAGYLLVHKTSGYLFSSDRPGAYMLTY